MRTRKKFNEISYVVEYFRRDINEWELIKTVKYEKVASRIVNSYQGMNPDREFRVRQVQNEVIPSEV